MEVRTYQVMKKSNYYIMLLMMFFLNIILTACVKDLDKVTLKTEMARISSEVKIAECFDFSGVKYSAQEQLHEPLIQVQNGVGLLSRNKSVMSSDKWPLIGDNSRITDGKKVLGADGYVEYKEGMQWIQIDLGQQCEIHVIWIWRMFDVWRKGAKTIYYDVVVQISDKEDFFDCVKTVFNNDDDNSSGVGRGNDSPYVETCFGKQIILKSAIKGRFIRIYSNGSTMNKYNTYVEVEVFGKK